MRALKGLVFAVAVAGVSDCLGPTEIELLVSTDVPCGSVNSTAIAVGPPGDDSRPVTAQTPACGDGGRIGTLVLTPASGGGGVVGIRVTLGVGGVPADQCAPPAFAGCIVARRQLQYVPHRPLMLPIELQQSCLGNPCEPNTTCVSGQCVDAGIPSCDETGTCTLEAGAPMCSTPTLVVALASPTTPHLVRANVGWGVGYDSAVASDAKRSYRVAVLDAAGTVVGDAQLSSRTILPGSQLGALGTDGVNFAAAYTDASTGQLAVDTIDPSGKAVLSSGVGANGGVAHAPLAGMHYDPSGLAFVFASTDPQNVSLWGYHTDTGNSAGQFVGMAGMIDPADTFANGVYWISVHDTATTCWWNGETFASATNSFTIMNATWASWPSCTMVRYGENAPGVGLFVTRSSVDGTLVASATPQATGGLTLGPADDQAAVILGLQGTQFRVVWRAAGDIDEAVVDTSLTPASHARIATATGYTGLGAGFDAASDGAGSGYGVAYWAAVPAAGIYFTRCQ